MARNAEGQPATDPTPVDAEISDAAISPDLEGKVQDALDDTFGGVDDKTLEGESKGQSRGRTDATDDDGGEQTTTVREHRRRIKKRGSNERRKQWAEETTGSHDDDGTEGSGQGEAHAEASEQDDDQGQDDQGQQAQANDAQGQGQPGEEPTGGEQTIPPHLIDAARRRGWSEDRIQRLVKADPDLALDTFEQLHEDANELSRRYAEMGRMMSGQAGNTPPQGQGQPPAQPYAGQQPPLQGQQQFQPPAYQSPQPGPNGQQQQGGFQQNGLLPTFQFAEEVTKDLDEDFRKGVLDNVASHLNQINDVINNVVVQHQNWIQERQNEVLYQQVDQFFEGQKGYEKLYGAGKDHASLSAEERQARMQVVQEADAIRAGAAYQGRQLTVQEALSMAHNLVSASYTKEAARREVQGQIRKRDGQITVRPTHRSGPPVNSKDPLAKATATASRKLRELNAGG